MPTPLTQQIAAGIVDYLREEDVPKGTRLVERALAARLRVSRSPVRCALRLLADDGVVEPAAGGGYSVHRPGAELLARTPVGPTGDGPPRGDDAVYARIAEDRVDGRLPDRVTESGLARRYDLTQGQVARVLRRIATEGWIERLPGYGWEFQPALTSLRSHDDSYRFRLAIEPAAILEPAFVLDRPCVEDVRDQQQRLVDGEIWSVSDAILFDLDSRFHEVVMGCCHNSFFIDSLARVDTVRRLAEHRRTRSRARAIVRCGEHVELAGLLLADQRREASALMHRHLAGTGADLVVER